MKNEDIKTFYIDRELHRQIKVEAAKREMTLRAFVEAALRYYLQQKEEKHGSDQ